MTGHMTYVSLDTMVYLHYRPADQLGLLETLSADAITVLVPRITVQELDMHKNTNRNKKIRERARKRLAALQQWIEAGEIRPGVAVKFLPSRPDVDFKARGLDAQWHDDQLLAGILQFKAEHSDDRVVLVTQDTGLLLTAKHLDIEAVTITEDKRLPQEEDPLAKENQELKRELLRLKTAQPKLIVRLRGMSDDEERATYKLEPPSDEPEFDKETFLSGLRERMPEEHPPPPPSQGPTSFAAAAAVAGAFGGAIPRSEYERYNRELKEYFNRMSNYVDQLAAYRSEPDRALLLELEVRNVGTVPAEDLDLTVHFPDGFALYSEDDIPGEPQKPEPPAKPQTELQRRMSGVATIAVPPHFSALRNLGPSDPFSLRKTNSYELTDHVERLKHGSSCAVRSLYLIFPSYASAKSFNFDYSIAAANLPQPATGQVHVVLEKR